MKVRIRNKGLRPIVVQRSSISPDGEIVLDLPEYFIMALKSASPAIEVSVIVDDIGYTREQLESMYREKFGKKPRANMKTETIRRKLGV